MASSLYLLFRPTYRLLDKDFQDKFGAFYDDVKDTKLAMLTPVFHNLRLLCLIPPLVMFSDFPLAQTIVYICSTFAGISWDLKLRPYKDLTIITEVVIMNIAKVAASGGYVALSLSTTTEETAAAVCTYELVVFVSSIGLCLAVAAAQQIAVLSEACSQRCGKGERRYAVSTSVSFVASQNEISQVKDTVGIIAH